MYKPQGRAVMYPNNPNDHVKMKNVEGLYSPLCIPHLAEGHIQKCEVWIDSFRGAKYKLQPMQICTRGGPLTAAFSGGLWFVNDNLPANGPLCQRHAGKNQLCTAYKRYIHAWYLSQAPQTCLCKKKLPGVNFYRFNAKIWRFLQI